MPFSIFFFCSVKIEINSQRMKNCARPAYNIYCEFKMCVGVNGFNPLKAINRIGRAAASSAKESYKVKKKLGGNDVKILEDYSSHKLKD